jgi:hypothetical protein
MTEPRGEASSTRWMQDPTAIRATLNPALIACVIGWSAKGYYSIAGQGLPWPLAHVVASVILHSPTREALPRSTARRLLGWRRENELLLADAPRRAVALRPYVDLGLRVGLRTSTLAFEGATLRGRARQPSQNSELADLARSATMLGRWFAPIPTATVMAQFGMRP